MLRPYRDVVMTLAALNPAAAVESRESTTRLRTLMDEEFDFVWRQLRRLGLSEQDADDGAQQVFIVASRKIDEITFGSERSFLYATLLRVASETRRMIERRRETISIHEDERIDPHPRADELLEQDGARAALDEVLDEMDLELRAVFVLFEIEELTMIQIAELLTLAPGTVASRLRRAREQFELRVQRMRMRLDLRHSNASPRKVR